MKPGEREILQRGKSVPLSPRERDRVRGKGLSDASAPALEKDYVFVPHSDSFPHTPTLTLGGEGGGFPSLKMPRHSMSSSNTEETCPLRRGIVLGYRLQPCR